MSEETTGTAVARTDEHLTEEGKSEVRAIQQAGALAVAKQKEINLISRQLSGMTWGSGYGMVKGEDLSGATRYAIAQLCSLTGANPGLHLYILGNRPYLNADYWAEKIAGQPRFVRYEQINLSTAHIEELRKIAEQAAEDGDEEEAKQLRRESRELARRRSHWSPPEWAQEVYETRIYRYSESAPLAAISAGRVSAEPWIETVAECNWAGGKPQGKTTQGKVYDADPVGNAEPSKTARSRSLRRCAIKAFQSTLQPVEHELRKLENAIEAEFEVIEEDRQEARAALPSAGEQQAVRIGAGEPAAAKPVNAEPLPVQEVGSRASAPTANARSERKKFDEGCRALGLEDVGAFSEEVLGHRQPSTLDEYLKLNAALAALADGPAEGDGQESLL